LAVVVTVVATASLSAAKPGKEHVPHGRAQGWHRANDESHATKHGAGNRKEHAGGNGGGRGADKHSDRTHPPGNNGTVKIDGLPLDSAPNNEPHPGCTFEIDFYGFDEGDLDATYILELHPPSGRGTLTSGTVFIGEDAAGGGRDLDASTGLIDLGPALADSGASANRNQGFHVRLTVHAEGSIGSDVKHKVFWVSECAPQRTTTTTTGGSGHGRPRSDRHPGRPTGHHSPARPARPVTGTPAFTG
jgi:hypothetical protein